MSSRTGSVRSTHTARSSINTADRLEALVPGAFPDLRSASQASLTTQQVSLQQILYDRRAEYTRSRNVRIKVGSWNVASKKGTEQDVAAWFVRGKGVDKALADLGVAEPSRKEEKHKETVADQEARFDKHAPTVPYGDWGSVPGDDDVDLYVLGLQEIVDITSAAEALKPYTDPTMANKYKASLEAALPEGYQLVAEQQLLGLWLVIYASPALFPQIKNISTTSVGTGLMGYMANKGAVTARIVLGETTRLVFINSHLGAGADKAALERRIWDVAQVTQRTRFAPIVDSLGSSQNQGEGLGDEEFAFWFGDLNFRIEGMPGDDVRRLLTVHTKDMDREGERPSTSDDSGDITRQSSDGANDSVPLPPELDPASLQTTISCLLPHDELHQQMKLGKAFHDGWEEGPIRFLPTYKYDVGKVGVFDSSEKHRCPSWCDRILYRTRTGKQRYDQKVKEDADTRRRDEEMKKLGMDMPGTADVLFDYDPDTDGDNGDYDEYEDNTEDPEPEQVMTKDGFQDEILLEYYTNHMRVLSSDHKPLDAVFSLKFDAVVPDLKAAIHSEVARELDRQENEGRPSIAVVVDRATGSSSPSNDKNATDSSFDGVDFGDVKFAKSKRRNITIANTGRVPATFGFADRPIEEDQDAGPFPSWLSVTFDKESDARSKSGPDDIQQRYTLAPAEVINAELKLKLKDVSSVRNLNNESESLDEVLVLRVENGRDHFLPLRGHWQPSALARTVDKLIKIPEGGIRRLQHQMPSASETVKWSVPREIFRLTEAIEDLTERALAEWDMTKSSEDERAPWMDNAGWPFVKTSANGAAWEEQHENELADLYDALDTDSPFAPAFDPATPAPQRVELLAAVLMTFLSSLEDGVVTKDLWKHLETSIVSQEKSKQQLERDDQKMAVLEIMASQPPHNATFLLLLSFLQNLVAQISTASAPAPDAPRKSIEMPSSPQAKVHRRTLSKVAGEAVRQLVVRNYCVVFADAIFRSNEDKRMKEKDKAIRKERMIRVLDLFLGEQE
ncbi:Phosphoinositide 5-phosphatase [Ascochyta rabiei]|uniref:Phosphatidylinositol dephosphorylation n=1 Tax=Didymella rabiei TaxID=5454 RepID=A0A163BL38_DIDRA|nr:Phosphoinositide 5-phosphatase [Ascochyta rabiei]KZM21831.1 phosphatidylinositol dephosphorylation [Ascochyta rabiei]UPX12604.1 Phosphoinositide 5-phosphatase [Ascochyta rabiei]